MNPPNCPIKIAFIKNHIEVILCILAYKETTDNKDANVQKIKKYANIFRFFVFIAIININIQMTIYIIVPDKHIRLEPIFSGNPGYMQLRIKQTIIPIIESTINADVFTKRLL